MDDKQLTELRSDRNLGLGSGSNGITSVGIGNSEASVRLWCKLHYLLLIDEPVIPPSRGCPGLTDRFRFRIVDVLHGVADWLR
jgi:hypothetical protein